MARSDQDSSKYLGIDTSIRGLKMSLYNERGEVACMFEDYFNTASYSLSKGLHSLLALTDSDIKSIKAILVISGPGSFTGIKVGVSFSKGLALALNCPIISINTLRALAISYIELSMTKNAKIISLLPAIRDYYYYSIFNIREGLLDGSGIYFGQPPIDNDSVIVTAANLINVQNRTNSIINFYPGIPLEYLGSELLRKIQLGIFEDVIIFEPDYGKDFEITLGGI